MNDFEYDAYVKKRIAQGYRNKKNGSKSSRCPLPSDHMTQKQWKERNGDIVSYQLNAPMTWSMLKAMPVDLQKEYIKNLRDKYGTTATDLAKFLGVTPGTVTNHCKETLGIVFKPGQRMTKEQRSAFSEFLGEPEATAAEEPDCNERTISTAECEPEVELPEWPKMPCEPFSGASAKKPSASSKGNFGMKALTMSFSGNFDPDALRNSLLLSIGEGTPVKLDIVCSILC